MYSTTKNIILKKLKFVLAGILLITILPGNAGENNDGRYPDNTYPEFFDAALTSDLNRVKSGEFVSRGEVSMLPDSSTNIIPHTAISLQKFNISKQNCREISPTCRSFNLYTNIQ
jgi:hypothetical protein